MSSILGVDVGGTFTDFFLWQDGRLFIHKRPSTPQDPSQAVILGLEETGWRPAEVVHGSTVATNAVLERKGARTALVTTRGFRDVLVIGRQTRPRLYELEPRRPPPIVPDELRFEVDERLDFQGRVLRPLDPSEVEEVLERVLEAGAESLAVCLLFSFQDASHERMVAVSGRRRGLFVSASHEVLPEYREYERTSTTALNAYVAPVMGRYLARLEEGLSARGVKRLRVMQSGGGSADTRTAAALAVRTILSGPAGGVAGAFAVAAQAGFRDIITFDMGGTSTDVCLCPGRIPASTEAVVGGCPVRTPVVDVHTVGAGGGSIAAIDAGGALRVGPESAGAEPGPACYPPPAEGTLPTVTDAHLLMGRLLADRFLGGRLPLSEKRARWALAGLVGSFGGDALRAAESIVRVANANMERALRVISVQRGYDPRLFTLVAFGGAGPLHACDLAEALGIPRVLVPRYPGVLSALGMAAADVSRDYSQAFLTPLPADDSGGALAGRLLDAYNSLERQAREEMLAEGRSRRSLRLERAADLRYAGQSHELTVPVDEPLVAQLLSRFHALHKERYGYADAASPVEVVTLRLRAVSPVDGPQLEPLPEGGVDCSAARIGERSVWFSTPDGAAEAAVFDRERLLASNVLRGPALILQVDATTVVPPGWHGTVDAWGNLVLERE
jgi:N-methylhydantoinase A